MEEKILIKSEKYNVKKFFKIMLTIGVTLSIIWMIGGLIHDVIRYENHTHSVSCLDDDSYNMVYEIYQEMPELYGFEYMFSWEKDDSYFTMNEYIAQIIDSYEVELTFGDCVYSAYSNAFIYIICESVYVLEFLYYLIPIGVFAIVGALICLWLNSYNLTVSDKRVSGEVFFLFFSKKVDLPIDSVSATSIISLFKGVGVSTPSGRISFLAIKNAKEIYEVLNDLLIKRQEEKTKNTTVVSTPATDAADQLKKFKELLDCGIITQEEFDAKKKQLLGL